MIKKVLVIGFVFSIVVIRILWVKLRIWLVMVNRLIIVDECNSCMV